MTATPRLRRMLHDDLDRVREWRNDDRVRRQMYSTEEISAEQHRNWFEQKMQEPGRRLMILEVDGKPLGFVNLGPCDAAGSMLWGLYAAPGAPAGTGRQLGEAALDYAFNTLGARQVRGEVLEHNSASLAFHGKLGFSQAGEPFERQLPSGRSVRVIDFVLESEKFRKRPDSP